MSATGGVARAGSIFVFDGIFLHRPELADYWDCSVFLDVERVVPNERMARRVGTSADRLVGQNSRYVEGQRIYLETCHPSRVATIVTDNNDLARPHIIR